MTQKQLRQLIEMAKRARRGAYSPYSRYSIGAAVLTESGRMFSGANVENASYGLSICAERVAIFNAVTRGEKGLRAVCVVGKKARPCGACRQVMLEFSAKDTQLVCVDVGTDGRRDSVTLTPMTKVLPMPFDPLEAGLLPPNPQNLLKRRARSAHRSKGRRSPLRKRSTTALRGPRFQKPRNGG